VRAERFLQRGKWDDLDVPGAGGATELAAPGRRPGEPPPDVAHAIRGSEGWM